MSSEFEMSMAGEINFFIGLQIKQSASGTTICQQKYIKEILKRFHMEDAKPIDLPIEISSKFDSNKPYPSVNETTFRGIISSLLYFITSRPDIVVCVGICARF